MREDVLAALVEAVYHAATDSATWPGALHQIASHLGGGGASIIPNDPTEAHLRFGSRQVQGADRLYYEHWWRYSPLRKMRIESGLETGEISDQRFLSDHEIERHPYYRDFLMSYGVARTSHIYAKPVPDFGFGFSVQRAIGASPEPEDERRARHLLARHISRSLSLSRELTRVRSMASGFVEICSRMDSGVALLNRHGHVLFLNRALEQVLGDGLTYAETTLHASLLTDQPRLARLLRGALAGQVEPDGPDSVRLRRPSGRSPLLVRAVRLPSLPSRTFDTPPGLEILLLVYVPDAPVPDLTHLLRSLGLAPAEAHLALLLARGDTLKGAADRSKIAAGTARVGLSRIFGKLGIHTQSQLMRLVMRLSVLAERSTSEKDRLP